MAHTPRHARRQERRRNRRENTNAETGGPSKSPAGNIKKSIGDTDKIIGAGQTFADQFVNKYLPQGLFGQMTEGTTPEMRAFLENLNKNYLSASEYTPLEQEALGYSREGLQGYEAPVVQAMREQALQELNRNYLGQQRQLMGAQARSGVRGAAGAAQAANLGAQKMQTQGNLERDLLIENAKSVERARTAFADLTGQTETARFGRTSDFGRLYGGALAGEEQVQRGVSQFNIGQRQNEGLARSGLALSGLGTYTGILGNQQAQDIASNFQQQLIDQQKANQDWLEKDAEANRRFMANVYANQRY